MRCCKTHSPLFASMNILHRFLLRNHVASFPTPDITDKDVPDITRSVFGFSSWQGAGSPPGQMDWRWIPSHGFAKEACPGKCRYVYWSMNSSLQAISAWPRTITVTALYCDSCTSSNLLLLLLLLIKALYNQSCNTAPSTCSFQKLLQTQTRWPTKTPNNKSAHPQSINSKPITHIAHPVTRHHSPTTALFSLLPYRRQSSTIRCNTLF